LDPRKLSKEGLQQKIASQATSIAEGSQPKLAFLKKLIDLFKNDIVCNFSISLISPHVVATVHGKTSGLK